MRYNGKGSGDDKNLEGPDTPDGPQLFPILFLYSTVFPVFPCKIIHSSCENIFNTFISNNTTTLSFVYILFLLHNFPPFF